MKPISPHLFRSFLFLAYLYVIVAILSFAETAKTSMEVEEEPDVEDEDEDLGFDPFCESQRGLEDLLRGESAGSDAPESYFGYG